MSNQMKNTAKSLFPCNFTQVPNEILNDVRVSSVAFKLFTYIMYRVSNSGEWVFYQSELLKHFKEGRDAIRAAKNQLVELGYLDIARDKDEKGRFKGTFLTIKLPSMQASIDSRPGTDFPAPVHPSPDYPAPANPPLLIKNINNKDITNKDDIEGDAHAKKTKSKIFIPPTLEEVKQYCLERDNGVCYKRFFNFYESSGWMRGKTKIKDWKAAVRTWETREEIRKPHNDKQANFVQDSDESSLQVFKILEVAQNYEIKAFTFENTTTNACLAVYGGIDKLRKVLDSTEASKQSYIKLELEKLWNNCKRAKKESNQIFYKDGEKGRSEIKRVVKVGEKPKHVQVYHKHNVWLIKLDSKIKIQEEHNE